MIPFFFIREFKEEHIYYTVLDTVLSQVDKL